MKKKNNSSFTGDMIKTGIATMVGVGMIDATATQVAALPAGTAKTLAGTAVGLQGVALMGPSIKLAKKSLSGKKFKII
jgi:hypothetical protein